MYRILAFALIVASCLTFSPAANAFFFFWFPTGGGGSGTDPDSIALSSEDRVKGRCAAYHYNQGKSRSVNAEQQSFHDTMMFKAVSMSSDQEKVKQVAEAYSGRWSKAAAVDMNTNRSYGAQLAAGCQSIGLPISIAEQETMKRQEEARQQEEARRQAEARRQEEAKRQEESQKQEEAKRIGAEQKPTSLLAAQSTTITVIDFNAEARKSARILGCASTDLKVVGAEDKNVIYLASCESGGSLTLACDPAGLCLKK